MAIMENKRQNKSIWKLMMVICVVGVLVAAVVLGVKIYRQNQAEAELEALANQTDPNYVEERTSAVEAEELVENWATTEPTQVEEVDSIEVLKEMGVPIPEKEIDFDDLVANTNEHIYAWIYIPDTKIDYPVLQHPTDNVYYLERNLDGSKGYPGCIYTEDYNSKDFSDPNTVLYGHNMKNGTMFAGLHKYEDMEYLLEHPYVYVYTPEKLYVYEIFAAYEFSNKHLLLNYDLEDEVFYQRYLDEIEEVRTMTYNRKEEVEVTTDNHIITLSTCVANKGDRRYLVQGVLLNED